MNEQTARAIIEVNEAIAAAENFQTLSDTLFSSLSALLNLKWLVLYNVFPRDTKLNATFSGELPAAFNDHADNLENLLRSSLAGAPGICTFFSASSPTGNSNTPITALVMTIATSPTSHRLSICLDWHNPNDHDVELLAGIRPLVCACSQTILDRRQADLRSAINPDDRLRPYILIDQQGALVDFPQASMSLLQGVYLDHNLSSLPAEIDDWAKHAMNQLLIGQARDSIENLLIFRRIGLKLKIILLDGGNPFGLLHLVDKRSPDDFSPLIVCGLSMREIEVLNYLPTGYSNAQIAMALGIKEITVKKHLKAIGDKLGASGKTEILYTALAKLLDLSGKALAGL